MGGASEAQNGIICNPNIPSEEVFTTPHAARVSGEVCSTKPLSYQGLFMLASDQKQEHTDSYYAASVDEVTDYPCLTGAESADVCVVGAGYTGISTALSLA